jgi:hypothetical protein
MEGVPASGRPGRGANTYALRFTLSRFGVIGRSKTAGMGVGVKKWNYKIWSIGSEGGRLFQKQSRILGIEFLLRPSSVFPVSDFETATFFSVDVKLPVAVHLRRI